MTSIPAEAPSTPSVDEEAVKALYVHLLDCWNRRDGDAFAASFTEDAHVVGFDGSQMTGSEEIGKQLRQIFTDHPTPAYVGKVRGVSFPAPDVSLLRAVAGM